MSQTTSSAAVSASTTGSVCTTVEGKLITSRPTAPSRMADLQRQLRHLDPQAEVGDPGELVAGLLAMGEVAVDAVLGAQRGHRGRGTRPR